MEELYNEFADIAALEKVKDQILAIFAEIKAGVKSLNDIGVNISAVNSVRELTAAQQKYSDQVKINQQLKEQLLATEKRLLDAAQAAISTQEKVNTTYKQSSGSLEDNIKLQLKLKQTYSDLTGELKRTTDAINLFGKGAQNPANAAALQELTDKQVGLVKSIEEIKRGSSELQRTIKLQTKENLANADSIDEMQAQYDRLFQLFRGLSEADRSSDFGTALAKDLDGLSTKMNALRQSAGNFKDNIGRYAGSLAAPFELLANKLEEVKANLAKGIGIGGTDEAALKRSNTVINTITDTLEKSTAAGVTSVKQVKNLSNAFTDLSITIGKAGGTTETSFLTNLGNQIGEAKDDVADLKAELALNASDTKGIDNVIGSLNALAGIAQGAAGAYALLGANEEDAAKVTAKLIAVQGIANSIQQVGNELTRKGTIANKAYEFVINQVTIATNVNAASTARLNAVLKLSTIGIIIAAVAGLVYIYQQLRKATDEAGQSAKDLAEIRAEGLKNAAEELTKVKLLYDATQNLALSQKERKKAVDELQKQYPAYFKNLTDEEILAGKAAKAYDLLSKSIIQTALAQAAKAKITEIAAGMLEATLKVEEANKRIKNIQEGGVVVQDKIVPQRLASGNVVNIAPSRFSTDEKDKEKAISAIKTKFQEFFTTVDAGNARIQAIIDGIGANNLVDAIVGKPDTAKASVEKLKKVSDKTAEEILKSNYEIAKEKLQRDIDSDKEVIDNETKTFQERIDALKTFTASQMALIDIEQTYEIASEKLKRKEVIDGLEQERAEILKNKDLTREQKLKGTKEIDEQIKKERLASNKAIQVIEEKAFTNILNAGKEFNKGLKKLADERAQITREEQQQIEDYETFTTNAIKKARQAQLDAEKKYQEDRKKLIEKAEDDLKAKKKELYKEAFDTLVFFLTASIDKEVAAIDRKKDLLDKETERRILNINMLGLSETQRIKETAKVQKQAAFEEEQLEKRKRKLLIDRAKIEKAVNIASIIANTAAAVIKTLREVPYPYNIALAVVTGAIGALQLARAIAAPIPQYRVGTDSAKKGPALVSEEGPELMKRNGQYFLTPDRPTIMEMQGGEQITPADVTKDIMNSVKFTTRGANGGVVVLKADGMTDKQAEEIIDELKGVKNETAKSRVNLTMIFDNGWTTYIQKNTR